MAKPVTRMFPILLAASFMLAASSLGSSIVVISMKGCLEASIILTSSRDLIPHFSAVLSSPSLTSGSLGSRTTALNVCAPIFLAARALW